MDGSGTDRRPDRRPSSRGIWAVVVLVAALAGCGGGADGPLAGVGFSGGASTVSIPQLVDVDAMFGVAQVTNDGDAPAVVDRISLVDPPRALEVVDTYIAGAERRGTPLGESYWAQQRDYPRLNPAAGYRVQPGGRDRGQSAQLLFVVRGTEPGLHKIREVAVDYHVGDDRYRLVLPTAYTACVAARGAPIRCPGGIAIDPPKRR